MNEENNTSSIDNTNYIENSNENNVSNEIDTNSNEENTTVNNSVSNTEENNTEENITSNNTSSETTENTSTYTEQQDNVIYLQEIHNDLGIITSFLVFFVLVIILKYTYKFFNMFFVI